MPISENRCFELLREDNGSAFRQIYELYWGKLYRISFSILRSEDLAKDIVQEVFVTIWLKRKELDIKNGKSYLYQATKLKCFEHLRKNKIDTTVLDRVNQISRLNNIEETINYNETRQKLKKGMETLPQKSRKVFQMSRYQELSNKEIAEQLHISTKAVEYHITQSLRHLRQVMTGILVCIFLLP